MVFLGNRDTKQTSLEPPRLFAAQRRQNGADCGFWRARPSQPVEAGGGEPQAPQPVGRRVWVFNGSVPNVPPLLFVPQPQWLLEQIRTNPH